MSHRILLFLIAAATQYEGLAQRAFNGLPETCERSPICYSNGLLQIRRAPLDRERHESSTTNTDVQRVLGPNRRALRPGSASCQDSYLAAQLKNEEDASLEEKLLAYRDFFLCENPCLDVAAADFFASCLVDSHKFPYGCTLTDFEDARDLGIDFERYYDRASDRCERTRIHRHLSSPFVGISHHASEAVAKDSTLSEKALILDRIIRENPHLQKLTSDVRYLYFGELGNDLDPAHERTSALCADHYQPYRMQDPWSHVFSERESMLDYLADEASCERSSIRNQLWHATKRFYALAVSLPRIAEARRADDYARFDSVSFPSVSFNFVHLGHHEDGSTRDHLRTLEAFLGDAVEHLRNRTLESVHLGFGELFHLAKPIDFRGLRRQLSLSREETHETFDASIHSSLSPQQMNAAFTRALQSKMEKLHTILVPVVVQPEKIMHLWVNGVRMGRSRFRILDRAVEVKVPHRTDEFLGKELLIEVAYREEMGR